MEKILKELSLYNKRIKNKDELTDEERMHFLELSDSVNKFVDNIDNDYAAACITKRYIEGKQWSDVAEDLGQFTEDSVRKYASRAVKRYS